MIEIKNLVKAYGNIHAVNGISFSVNEGEIVGFLGSNGAGKSTTMNILTGYLSSTSGVAKVNGIDVLDDPIEAKKNIGYLPELPPLYYDMTVKEYLRFVYALKGCKLNRDKHIEEICKVVKISNVYERLIKNLSKGYKQRVGFAQALIGNPKVLIFDEPTVGLDPSQIIEMRTLIRALGRNHTVILSTHILFEAQAVCDRIIIIDQGRIIADEKTENISMLVSEHHRLTAKISGPPDRVISCLKGIDGVTSVEQLAARDGDAVAYMIEAGGLIDVRKPMFFAMAEHGWPIIGLEASGTNLEDIFIKLVNAQKKRVQTVSKPKAEEVPAEDAAKDVRS